MARLVDSCECGKMRDVLFRFAQAMEHKLRRNDHKTAWRTLPIEALRRQMELELEEFKVAYDHLAVDEARRELVDIANFALILHDRLGMLPAQDRPMKDRANAT